jgi:mevalonate pyrophosphate decarboxylase
MWRGRQSESRASVGDGSISAFGMNCGLGASGSGLSMVLRSCEHGDELVSIKDENCLERVSRH